MSPCSGAVLGGAAFLTSPALWRAFVEGSAPIEVALSRYLVSVAVCWALLAILVALVGPQQEPPASRASEAESEAEAEAKASDDASVGA